jgi:glyoxylase-like metal-dependent hydrolase (beta-lactamase superfamily II)
MRTFSSPVSAARSETERLRKSAEIRSVAVGEIAVTYLPDGAAQVNPIMLFPDMTGRDWWQGYPEFLDVAGYLTVSCGALLIERGDRAMLLDAGYGPGPARAPGNDRSGIVDAISGGALLKSLASAGRAPADIEAVHLHMEHVGWAALPDGDYPFGDATCFVPEAEWHARRPVPGVTEEMLGNLESRVKTVTDGEEIFPGVRVAPLPGHAPGHAGFRISSQGQELVAFGDIMHSSFQVYHPELCVAGDWDDDQARQSRYQILTELAATGKIGYGGHFADVVFGQVRYAGPTMTWVPVP